MQDRLSHQTVAVCAAIIIAFAICATAVYLITGVNWVGDLLSEPLPPCYLGYDCSVGSEFQCEMRKQAVMYECVR